MIQVSSRSPIDCCFRYKFGLDAADADTLAAYWPPAVDDDAEIGWEECTDAALTYLLRTLLAKQVCLLACRSYIPRIALRPLFSSLHLLG